MSALIYSGKNADAGSERVQAWLLSAFKEARPPGSLSGEGLDGESFRRCVSERTTDTEISPRRLSNTTKQRCNDHLYIVAVVSVSYPGELNLCMVFYGCKCVGKIAEARRGSCGSIQRLSLPEKMPGLQQPGGPPVCLSSHRLATVIPAMFHTISSICTQKCNNIVSYISVSRHSLTFRGVIDRISMVLTTVAGTKKHGCSAESPIAARRAAVQSAPLEGYGDSRGLSVATREAFSRENTRHNTVAYVIWKMLQFNVCMSGETFFLHMICQTKLALRCATL